jgi:DNA-binding HxlR family transcriptional regulator
VKTPKPGQPVRGSKTGRPIMALLDLLGRRWTLRIIWELREEAATFLELQGRCDNMSSSTLVQRLSELSEARIVEQDVTSNRYNLTTEGLGLVKALTPLNEWAQDWAKEF